MNPVHIGILGVVFLIILLFSKFPVAFCMALVGLLGFGYLISPQAALSIIAKDFYTVFSSYDLTVVPLFVFMGQILFFSGISRKLYDAAFTWFGHYKGGLAMATVGACAAFSAICGSTNATAATMASVALPEMKRLKYRDELATGVVAAGGSLGILIPPSVIFIVYGIQTEQSIGKLFMAGILPGVLLSMLFIVTIYTWVTLKPAIAPRIEKRSFKQRMRSLTGLIEVIILFFMVMGGLFLGIFTPTEAGAVGAFGGVLIPLIRGQLSWQGLFFNTNHLHDLYDCFGRDGLRPLPGGDNHSQYALRLGCRSPSATLGYHACGHVLFSHRRMFYGRPGDDSIDDPHILSGRRCAWL
jgi:C4-dicarboxylate transporter DctM subunit